MEIGIIGALGDMGRLYANKFIISGYIVHLCDREDRFEELKTLYYADLPSDSLVRVYFHQNGHLVSRRSDFIIYSVEAEHIANVVSKYGMSTKYNAIVGGQTSVKHPEILAFEKHIPKDVSIITIHSLHGPSVDPAGQPLIVCPHRLSDNAHFEEVKNILSCFQSNVVEITYEEHDKVTADTQAVTHLAFLSMGSAWSSAGVFPWLTDTYIGGIENVKVMMTMRIYSSKWHVYAGLAILNPHASRQAQQYARSTQELFQLMIQEDDHAFRSRLQTAADFVFGGRKNEDPLLSDELLDNFSLSNSMLKISKPNSHLSLLAIVDSWHKLGINPYKHMICQTPPFRLWLGIAEYLFKSPAMLENSIETALYDKSIRSDDLKFVWSVGEWSQVICLGSFDGYREKFERVSEFFSGKNEMSRAKNLSAELIKKITAKIIQ